MGTPIPAPPGLPLLGNINDVDPEDSMASLMHLVELYGTSWLPFRQTTPILIE